MPKAAYLVAIMNMMAHPFSPAPLRTTGTTITRITIR